MAQHSSFHKALIQRPFVDPSCNSRQGGGTSSMVLLSSAVVSSGSKKLFPTSPTQTKHAEHLKTDCSTTVPGLASAVFPKNLRTPRLNRGEKQGLEMACAFSRRR